MPQIRSNSIYPAIAKNPEEYRDVLIKAGVDLITINEVFDYRWKEVPDKMIMNDWACSFPFQRLVISSNAVLSFHAQGQPMKKKVCSRKVFRNA